MPWSLDICTTQRSPVHRVGIHGISNRGTFLYPAHNNLISSSDDISKSAWFWADHWWNAESWKALRNFELSTPFHPPGMSLLRTACVRLNCLRTGVRRFQSCLHKWSMAFSETCECGAEDQIVDHYCLPISNPLTSTWSTAWRFWMMRQSTGCSIPTPGSSVTNQWTERTGSNDYDEAPCACVL